MRRFLRYVLVSLAGVVIAAIALILEGTALEAVFDVDEVPTIDFATLQRPATPNQYLLCPAGRCAAETEGAAPVFDVPVMKLQSAWDEMIAQQPRVLVLRRDPANVQVDYVQRSRLLRFPDLVTVRFIAVDDGRATLAIYSRSVYGQGDLGVNRARVEEWLARLKARLG